MSGVNLFVKPLSFLFIIISTRLLGADDFGKFAFATALVTFINTFFEGGINIHTIRELSAEPAKYADYFSSSFSLKVIGGLLTALCTLIVLYFTHYETTIVYLLLISVVFILFYSLLEHLRRFFRAFEIMRYEAYSIAFEKIGMVAICGTVLFINQNVVLFTASYAFTYIISFGYTLILTLKVIGKPKRKFTPRSWFSDLLKPAFPFAIMNILIIGRSRAGTILLKFISQKDDWVGYYNAGYRLLDSFMLFPKMIATPLLPVFVRIQKRKDTVRKLLNGGCRNILGIAALVSFPILLMHNAITVLLFGPTFSKASLAVGILALNMIPAGLTTIIGNLVAATDRQSIANKMFIFETVTTIALYSFFISISGYIGAAIASVIGDTVYLGINLWVVRDYVYKSGLLSLLMRFFLIFGVLILLQFTPIYPVSEIGRIISIVTVIVIGLLATGIIRRKELRDYRLMFRSLLSGIHNN